MSPDAAAVHTLATLVHGRYLVVRGARAGERPPLLVGFHGYGENAERHLGELLRIPGVERWLVCAVHALHPFYNQKTGDIIGCWMTSRDRELAIADNVRYTAAVVDEVRRREEVGPGLVFAGFSQGVAMAYRAAARSGFLAAGLIALAGDVPPDVAAGGGQPLPPILLGRGVDDRWYDDDKMRADLETLERLGVEVESHAVAGGHEWTDELRTAAGRFLDRVAGSAG